MYAYFTPMRPYVFPSNKVPRPTEWATIFALDDGNLDQFLLNVFRYAELSSLPVEFDAIMDMAKALRASGKVYKDAIAVSWLSQNTTARRLEIASAFLSGYWSSSDCKEGILSESMEVFMRLCHRIKVSDDSLYRSIFALTRALACDMPPEPKARMKIRGYLRASLTRIPALST